MIPASPKCWREHNDGFNLSCCIGQTMEEEKRKIFVIQPIWNGSILYEDSVTSDISYSLFRSGLLSKDNLTLEGCGNSIMPRGNFQSQLSKHLWLE